MTAMKGDYLTVEGWSMDLALFEREVNSWFEANAPRGWEETVRDLSEDEYTEFQRSWLRKLNTQGFGAPRAPREYGGGGFDARQQAAIYRAAARVGAPPNDTFEISINHVPETLLAAGTEEQKRRYIRAAIDGTVWCQGFSEPDAGSDLARIRTRAVRRGTNWHVTGQKIWSSHAAQAAFCLLLVRSDPDAPAHHGITYFIMDMNSPGVSVRPIRQIHGPSEFCEIFLDDVAIPEENILGNVNEGWQVAMATLSAERGPMAMPTIERMGRAMRRLAANLDLVDPEDRGHIADSLAGLIARHAAVQSLTLDTIDQLTAGKDSAGLASLIKISFSELLQEFTGLAALVAEEPTLSDHGSEHFLGYVSGHWMTDWLGSWSATIAGGTNEIQRDIIAERILGLPRSPRSTAKER